MSRSSRWRAARNSAFTIEVPPDLPPARGDDRRLTQVLLNLVGNAIKFTDAGEVAVKAAAANGAYTISVRDTGPGIARSGPGQDLRGIPAGGQFADQDQGRHRARPVDRQAHRRNARRTAVGRVEPGQRFDVFVHGAAHASSSRRGGHEQAHSRGRGSGGQSADPARSARQRRLRDDRSGRRRGRLSPPRSGSGPTSS